MLYFITGANGAGKTANSLKWVRDRQIKESRPVAYNGRFDLVEGGELKGWKKIDFKDWQAEPDGTIFFIDEAHNDLPNRPPSAAVPEHVRMLAEHRKRGFDFYLVTQHPQNVDSFVRRLVGSPGWHRHLKRVFGSTLVSVLQWDYVNPNCEKAGSSKQAQVTTQAIPKEVYGWYTSASLHTGKLSIPKQVWYMLAAIAVAAFFIFKFITGMVGGMPSKQEKQQPGAAQMASAGGQNAAQSPMARAMSASEYLQMRKARLPDFPHTAPVYDDITRPAFAPYPAACVEMHGGCKCYSQQATLLHVSANVCVQIVRQGYFVEWQQPAQPQLQQPAPQPVQQQPRQLVSAPVEVVAQAAPVQPQQPVNEWAQALAARNAQVRSEIGR